LNQFPALQFRLHLIGFLPAPALFKPTLKPQSDLPGRLPGVIQPARDLGGSNAKLRRKLGNPAPAGLAKLLHLIQKGVEKDIFWTLHKLLYLYLMRWIIFNNFR
jgi:hypothetical protein